MARELTEALLDGLQAPAIGRLEILDSRVEGLMLRVTANDVRTWTVRGRLPDGTRKRVTLGKYPELSISKARRAARQALGDIERGIDHTVEKRVAREARRMAVTVEQRLAEWQAVKQGAWSPRYAAEVKRLIDKVIRPSLGTKVLTEVTRAQWTGLASRLRERTPGTASWVWSTISSFLNHCEAAGWTETNPLPRRGRNHIAPHPVRRERVLSDDELKRVWHAAAELSSEKSRAFVRLMILSAGREREVADIAVDEINLITGQWLLAGNRTKNGVPRVVPLHPLMLAELTAILPAERVGHHYKLLGHIKGSGFSGFSKLKIRIDELSGVAGWVWHDLRRSCRTTLAKLGVNDRHAEAALGHVSDRSMLQRTYDVHSYLDEGAGALTVWQDHVTALLISNKAEERRIG